MGGTPWKQFPLPDKRWLLFLELRDRGHFGHVIPEVLLRYRVRDASMLRGVTPEKLELFRGELYAHRREASVDWVAPGGAAWQRTDATG